MRGLLIIILIALAIVVIMYTTKDSPKEESYGEKLGHAMNRADQLLLDTKIDAIKKALEAYALDKGEYPETPDALVPQYLTLEEHLEDPWGERFQITKDENMNLVIISPGKDRVPGNDDDIKRSIR